MQTTSISERSLKNLQSKYPTFFNEEFWIKEYVENQKSYPVLLKEYSLPYKATEKFLDYYGIKRRSIKEASNTSRTKQSREATCLTKYGAVNCLSKNTSSYHKRNETVKEKYGVNNVFQLKEVVEKICSIRTPEVKSECTKQVWQGKTEEEKQAWLHNSIHSFKIGSEVDYEYHRLKASIRMKNRWLSFSKEEKEEYLEQTIHDWKTTPEKYEAFRVKQRESFSKRNREFWKKPTYRKAGGRISKLENCFGNMLIENGFNVCNQFFIKEGRYFYDFFLPDYNTIIEINGDYWHCNPLMYKESDLVLFRGKGEVLASDVWKKDDKKNKFAEDNGYKVIIIWEKELKENDPFELFKLKIENL